MGLPEDMLSHSALVTSGGLKKEFSPREFALELRSHLNWKYSEFTGHSLNGEKIYGKFRMSRGTVCLDLPLLANWPMLEFWFDKRHYHFSVAASSKHIAREVAIRFHDPFSWDVKSELHWTAWHTYIFLSVS